MKTDREKAKEKKKAKQQRAKDEFKDLYKSIRYDENGNKLSKAEQNKLIMERLASKEAIVESSVGVEAGERKLKYIYTKVSGKVFDKVLGREITQIIETDC